MEGLGRELHSPTAPDMRPTPRGPSFGSKRGMVLGFGFALIVASASGRNWVEIPKDAWNV